MAAVAISCCPVIVFHLSNSKVVKTVVPRYLGSRTLFRCQNPWMLKSLAGGPQHFRIQSTSDGNGLDNLKQINLRWKCVGEFEAYRRLLQPLAFLLAAKQMYMNSHLPLSKYFLFPLTKVNQSPLLKTRSFSQFSSFSGYLRLLYF